MVSSCIKGWLTPKVKTKIPYAATADPSVAAMTMSMLKNRLDFLGRISHILWAIL